MNAFNTTGPSIFANDRAFTAQGDKGRSLSQSATARYTGLTDPRNNMRKVCKTFLRNDYWCKGLGFSPTKSAAYKKYQELMARRRKDWNIFPEIAT